MTTLWIAFVLVYVAGLIFIVFVTAIDLRYEDWAGRTFYLAASLLWPVVAVAVGVLFFVQFLRDRRAQR